MDSQVLYSAGFHGLVGMGLFYLLAGQFGLPAISYWILGAALFGTSIVVDYLYPKINFQG